MPRATGKKASAKAAQSKPRERQEEAKEPLVTDQQRAYVDHYLTHFNKIEAARQAGYSNARSNAYNIHHQRGVQHELQMRAVANFDYLPATRAYVSSHLMEIVTRCMASDVARDANGNPILRPVDVTTTDEDGNEKKVELAIVYQFDPRNAIAALSKIGESIGMFSNANGQVDEDAIRAALNSHIQAEIEKRRQDRAKIMQSAPVRTIPDQSDVLTDDVLGPRRMRTVN